MKEVFYNVWRTDLYRWSNSLTDNNFEPKPLTKEFAAKHCEELNICHGTTNRFIVLRLDKPRIKKVIPDFPLDPMLPVLEAGYIQDRQRKQFKG